MSLKGDHLKATLLDGEVFTTRKRLVVFMGKWEGPLRGKSKTISPDPHWTLFKARG